MKTGRVYKMVAGQGDEVYIGSTFNQLKYRFKQHKNDYKRWKNEKRGKCVCFELFEKYGVKNCKMILIKEYECLNKNHLLNYEQLWISKLNSVNEVSPAGYIINKSKKTFLKLYGQICYEKNKERKSVKVCCECGSVVRKSGLRKHYRTKKHQKLMQLKH